MPLHEFTIFGSIGGEEGKEEKSGQFVVLNYVQSPGLS